MPNVPTEAKFKTHDGRWVFYAALTDAAVLDIEGPGIAYNLYKIYRDSGLPETEAYINTLRAKLGLPEEYPIPSDKE